MICAVCGRDGRGMGFNLAMAWTSEHYSLADHKHIQCTETPHYLVAACSIRCLDAISVAYRKRVPVKTNLLEEKALSEAAKCAGGIISSRNLSHAFVGMSREDFAAVIQAAVLGFTEYMSKNPPDIREPMEKSK